MQQRSYQRYVLFVLVEKAGAKICEHLTHPRHYPFAQESAKICCAQGEAFKFRTQDVWYPFIPPCVPSRRCSGWNAALSPASLTERGLWDKVIQELLRAAFPNLLRLSQVSLSGQSPFNPVPSQTTMVKISQNSKSPAVGKQEGGDFVFLSVGQLIIKESIGEVVVEAQCREFCIATLSHSSSVTSCDWLRGRVPHLMKCTLSASSKESQHSPGQRASFKGFAHHLSVGTSPCN